MSEQIIHEFWISAKKSLGQNFLQDEDILEAMSQLLHVWGKNIIEIWPWYWALSSYISSQKPQNLELIELDRDMVSILQKRNIRGDFWRWNIHILQQDVLKYVPEFSKYSVIANIPYYITSPILRKFLYESKNMPEEMCILMQKDVAEKICKSKKNTNSFLSLMIEKKAIAREKIYVPPTAFFPVPKVDSSVVVFTTHDTYKEIDDDVFLWYLKAWFSAPRKKLIKNLQNSGYNVSILEKIFCQKWWSQNIRAEELHINDWISLIQI